MPKSLRKPDPVTLVFLLIEMMLYCFILATGGTVLVACEFAAIVLCFVYALIRAGKRDMLLVSALACTVGADFCLVVRDPIERLWGMVFFLAAQTLYAVKLHRTVRGRALLIVRIALVAAAAIIALAVLRERTDALALVSMTYYASLIANILVSARRIKTAPLLFIGFVPFLLCDTVIGLQVAADAYLPIAEGSRFYNILFVNFNLAWFFYLPSQVCLALSGQYQQKRCSVD